ncbi:MAG: glycosyltransferase family 4 protein [Muribaculaceae bacterium]
MTGLGNYSRYVVDALSRSYPHNHYRLYSPRIVGNQRLEPLLCRDNVALAAPLSRTDRAFSSLWRTMWMPEQLQRDGIDLYHGLSNEVPLTIERAGIASVVTIHDLIYRRQPRDYSAIDRRLYDFKYRRSAHIARRIIAISECTKRDLVNDYGIAPDKIDVIYQGCDPIFAAPVSYEQRSMVKSHYGLAERYIVCVGTVQPRKNQLLAVQALRGLPADVQLVIVGGRQKAYGREIDDYVRRHSLAGRIKWLEGVPFAHIPALYAMAQMSVYVSRYEGFGLPVVESLTAGTPVIAARGSCLEEAGGDGAIYISPDDADELTAAAAALLSDSYKRQRLADRGRRHAKRFSASDFARLTMHTYTKALLI